MTLKEIEKRKAEILSEMDVDGADLEKLEKEMRSLKVKEKAIKAEEEQRISREVELEDGAKEIRTLGIPAQEKNQKYDYKSKEYRTAFLKDCMGNKNQTKEERAAFAHVVETTGLALPKQTLDEIWDLVTGQHSIMKNIDILKTGTIIEINKMTAIEQGAAKKVGEGKSNDDEKNTFVKVTLTGNDFSKHIVISYAMAKMSVDAFEKFISTEIANQLGQALSEDVVATIKTDMLAANKINAKKPGELTFTDVANTFANLKRVSQIQVYANSTTIYKFLVGMVDTTGKPIFQLNANDGPLGFLIGAKVEIEDALADGEILVGDSKRFKFNLIQDILIENDKDIKSHTITYAGYARGQGSLIDNQSFALVTIPTA